jgi:hypothetical protein
MEYGNEHVNLRPDANTYPVADTDTSFLQRFRSEFSPDDPRNRERSINNTRVLMAAIARVAVRGGYVYITPGRYLFARPAAGTTPAATPRMSGDVVFPKNVTLWLAPGAVLVPLGNETPLQDPRIPAAERTKVRIEIQGDLIADLSQIFDPSMGVTGTSADAGLVLFASNRIREVYPEWWGANLPFVGNSRKNTLAIQAAIDAAYHQRVRGGFNTIPLVMAAQYLIDRELTVGVPTSALRPSGMAGEFEVPNDAFVPRQGIEITGERGVNTTTLLADRGFAGPSMMTVRGPVNMSLRLLGFNGNFIAREGLVFEPVADQWGHVAIEGCSFEFVLGKIVSINAERLRWTARPATSFVPPVYRRDFLNITFMRCSLYAGYADTDAMRTAFRLDVFPDAEGNLILFDLRLAEIQGLELRNCFLEGAASPGIRIFSGRFSMNETSLHVHRPLRKTPETQIPLDNLHYGFRHGSDISIEPPEPSTLPLRVVPATFTARECKSHSPQFLATHDPGARNDTITFVRSAVVVINLGRTHESQSGYFESGWTDPPGIYWAQPGQVGCPLLLIGGNMFGRRQTGVVIRSGVVVNVPVPVARDNGDNPGGNRNAVYVAPNLTGDIYDIANYQSNNVNAPSDAQSLIVFRSGGARPSSLRIRRMSPIAGA